MKKRLLILLILSSLIYLLSGCSAQYHIKRARKLAPDYFTTKVDTVRDTIFIEVAAVDTVFNYKFDTVEMWLDKTYVKYNYDTITNNVFIEVDCPDDSVVVETITEVREVPYVVPLTFGAVLRYFLKFWYIGIILLVIVAAKMLWRFVKPF